MESYGGLQRRCYQTSFEHMGTLNHSSLDPELTSAVTNHRKHECKLHNFSPEVTIICNPFTLSRLEPVFALVGIDRNLFSPIIWQNWKTTCKHVPHPLSEQAELDLKARKPLFPIEKLLDYTPSRIFHFQLHWVIKKTKGEHHGKSGCYVVTWYGVSMALVWLDKEINDVTKSITHPRLYLTRSSLMKSNKKDEADQNFSITRIHLAVIAVTR